MSSLKDKIKSLKEEKAKLEQSLKSQTLIEADVLYQKMGGRWYAFSVVEEEVYAGVVPEEMIEKIRQEQKAGQLKIRNIKDVKKKTIDPSNSKKQKAEIDILRQKIIHEISQSKDLKTSQAAKIVTAWLKENHAKHKKSA